VTSSQPASDSTEESGGFASDSKDGNLEEGASDAGVSEDGASDESGVAGAVVSFVSASRSPLSLIFRFGLLAHLHGRSIEAPEPGDRAEEEANQRDPAVGAEFAIEPPPPHEANEDREDKFEPNGSMLAEPLEIASQDFAPSEPAFRFKIA
jgi:hypothetical protein